MHTRGQVVVLGIFCGIDLAAVGATATIELAVVGEDDGVASVASVFDMHLVEAGQDDAAEVGWR